MRAFFYITPSISSKNLAKNVVNFAYEHPGSDRTKRMG